MSPPNRSRRRVLADFLERQRYNANQIEFVNMIIDNLTRNGVMDPGLLYESPYTDYNPNGLSGIFPDGEAKKIVDILSMIRMNAAA
jgi:type I restriction enzyme R subunit